MKPQRPVISPVVTTRRTTVCLFSGLLLASSVLLSSPGASAATPTPKPTPAPAAATATPMATPDAAASATPAPQVANYSGTQQKEYLTTARDAFVMLRQEKSQPYIDAQKEFAAAGGISAKGLNSKEAIAARRAVLAKCLAGNDAYLDFVKNQVEAYRAELAKTPLIPADVASVAEEFSTHANIAASTKLRETDRDALKCGDDLLAFLDKSEGSWSASGEGKLTFKKKSDVAKYSALLSKYNKLATEEQTMLAAMSANNVVPPASVPPSPSPAASVSPAPSASPAAAASPATKH